ncbi:MAG: hypothetical protein JWP62_757 [Blastococcus sp.]|nr:hypothetical protein [Blastococcus sp.]
MEVEAVGPVPSPRRPVHAIGVTAELAAARTKLREAAPAEHWDGVLAEVQRLQNEERMAPLASLQAVYAKLASGWLPPLSR